MKHINKIKGKNDKYSCHPRAGDSAESCLAGGLVAQQDSRFRGNDRITYHFLLYTLTFAFCLLPFAIPIVQAQTLATTVLLNSPANSNTTQPSANNPVATQGYASPIGPSANTTPIGLVICNGARDLSNPNDVRPICDFNYFLQEMRHVINWLFVIAIPIAIVLFAYGGILYILGTPGNRKKANEIFTAAGIGFGIMLIAWVSVYTIVSWLTAGNNGGSTNPTGITTFLGN